MRLHTLGCWFALVSLSWTAHAETKAKPAKAQVTQSEEIATDDLALGKTIASEPTSTPQAPVGESDNRYVYSPDLAASKAAPATPVAAPVAAPTPEPMPEDVPSALPKRLPYRNEPVMPGYVLEEQKRWWMVGVGGGLFIIGYVIGLGVAEDNDFNNGLGFAAIPIAGPWVSLAMHDRCSESEFASPSSSIVTCNDDAIQSGMIASGILQAGGLALLALGLGSTRQVWTREDLAIQVTPLVGRHGNGLSLRGAF